MKRELRSFLNKLRTKQPDISERLFRALNIKGDLPDLLSPEYDLGVTAEDLTRPEFWYLRRGASFDAGGAPGAVAAQFSFVSLGAPQLSPVLAIVESFWIQNVDVAARTYNVGLTYDVTNAANANQKPRDSRDGFRRSAFSVAARNSATAQLTGDGSLLVVVPAGGWVLVPGPFMLSAAKLSPAGQLPQVTIQTETLNLGFRGGFRWFERPLAETEF